MRNRCLSCGTPFEDFDELKRHKAECPAPVDRGEVWNGGSGEGIQHTVIGP